MTGEELLNEISRRIKGRLKVKSINDARLAKEIGVTQPTLNMWRSREKLTPKQIMAIIDRFEKNVERRTIADSITPIIEFFYLDRIESKRGANWELFSDAKDGKKHPYLSELKKTLRASHGVYIFHDSRGRAIYVGKAVRQDLWKEMNLAFNRDRGAVQKIKRVNHPSIHVQFKGEDEGRRRIENELIALHEIASYVSVYKVSEGLISKLEALLVRSFANDLLNIRMENF